MQERARIVQGHLSAFAHTPAIHNNLVTHGPIWIIALFDGAGEINAGDQWVLPNNGCSCRHGQRVFVVNGAVVDFDQDARIGECRVINFSDVDAVIAVLFGGEQCIKHMGYLV